jgi:SHS2 domain-containing protein
MKYETFEHEADLGIRGFGTSLHEAYENTATALFSIMINIDVVQQVVQRNLTVSAPDRELLLIEWLNALLSLSDIDRMVFSRFEVKIDGDALAGTAWGEPLDRIRHQPRVEVKGATYHMLKVVEENGLFIAQCVVDV